MLDKDLGDRLRRGEDVIITERDLDCGHAHTAGYTSCPSCGANVDPQHNFCPNCGQKL
jgi:predicted amidophosphoribosyltransferase